MRRYSQKPGYREERKAYAKERYQKNRERLVAEARAKRQANRQNPEKAAQKKAYDAQYYQTHKAQARLTQKKNYPKYRQKIKEYGRRHAVRVREREAGRRKPTSCEVCGGTQSISFDHCHQRGIFRGWLCGSCNKILGFANDNPDRLRKLIAYLERTKNLISPQLEMPV